MRVGVFTPLLSQLPLNVVVEKLAELGIDTVELGTGNYVGDPHCKLSMLENPSALAEFKKVLGDHGVSISALSCHGNALHPEKAFAQQNREVSRKTILLAEKLGVSTVVDFSGCPGDSPNATAPNWVTCPWPPDYRKVLDWQWNEVVSPFWVEHAKFAADHGVKIAVEMHPGFVVYNPETMLRLRSIAGKNIGCNFDPSHLFWQNIDPIGAVRVLADSIFHVHANGHGAEWWSELLSTLRMFGYDSVISIEHEDSILSPGEGLAKAANFLNRIVIREQAAGAWWS
jgi:sugar phosphate isomerase/epimerase